MAISTSELYAFFSLGQENDAAYSCHSMTIIIRPIRPAQAVTLAISWMVRF
jgi:hypothetical protein